MCKPMKTILFIGAAITMMFHISFAQNITKYNGLPAEDKYIVFKYKPLLKSMPANNEYSQAFQAFMQAIGAQVPQQKFPHAKMPQNCDSCVDITHIYDFYYTQDYPLEKVIAYLRSMPFIEYAEPNYIHELLYVPNDPEVPFLYHLNTCYVYDAWNVHKGDTNTVIAIVDAGVAIAHTDLVNQIKYNYADPINGFDDDYDGYIDNFRGWDFAEKDNNPDIGVSDHGTYVAGISNAEVHNSFATAGVGFKCKFLPIKVATDAGIITRGYEGIVYAANQGAHIINCSWGSAGSYTKYGQDVINYATFNCNSLVVGAAGNSNNTGVFYPASYNNALSVGSTQEGSKKWYTSATKGSNWNYYVDVSAPSVGYKTTAKNNGTTFVYGGTSFAAPIVSGVAALIKSKYPSYTPLDITERIRTTANDIYGITENLPYVDLLGSGEVNAYEALTNTSKPSIRVQSFSVTNRSGQYMYYEGDTLELQISFKNYLASATNMYITISCETSIIAPLESNVLIPVFDSGSVYTLSQPFIFKIVSTLPADINTHFKLTYASANYYGYEYIPVSFNPSYYDFEIGNFKATATANSSIGVMNPTNKQENGIVYKNFPNLLYQGGLVLAQNDTLISAQFRTPRNFSIVQFPKILQADSIDLLIQSKYKSNNLKLDITQYIYAWDDIDALIHEYRITNKTDSTIHNLKAGAFIDWQIISQFYNKLSYTDSLKLAHITTVDPLGFHAGIMSLHHHTSSIYAVDDAQGIDSVYVSDAFTDPEIWFTLNREKKQAGYLQYEGVPVASISYCTIGELPKDSTVKIRYAIIAGESKQDIVDVARILKQKYVIDTTKAPIINIAEPLQYGTIISLVTNSCTIQYEQNQTVLTIALYDMQGRKIFSHSIQPQDQTGMYTCHFPNIVPGIYTVKLKQGSVTSTCKIISKQ